MLYRPKYCCSCGEKIEREDWRFWTSRRFCALCETEHKAYDLLPRVIVGLAVIVSLFGVANYFRGSDTEQHLTRRSEQTPQKLKPASPVSVPSPGIVSASNGNAQPQSESVRSGSEGSASQISEQPNKERATSDDTVFYCGAITKKGTPCTRRVKKKGTFCWQHARTGAIAPTRF